MKKSLIFWFAAVTCAALFLVGCESPTNGESGAAGAPGTTQLSANITAASLQKIVDAGGPILISGTVEIGAGYVDLKGANITVDGTLSFASGGVILNARSANVVIGAGSITGANAVVIPPAGESVWDSVSGLTVAPLVSVAQFAAASGSGSYVVQDLSVDDAGKIGAGSVAAVVGSKTVYVLGTLTNAFPTLNLSTGDAANIKPLGNITSSANITLGEAAITGNLTVTGAATLTTTANNVTVGGNLTTGTGLLTTGANEVTVKGTLTAGDGVTLCGALTVGGNAAITGALTDSKDGANTVTFNGATASVGSYTAKATAKTTTFAGKAKLTITTLTDIASESTVTFNIPTTIAGQFAPDSGGAIIAGSGTVTFTTALGTTGTNNLSIKSTGGVTLTAANTIGSKTVATKVTLKGDGTNGVTIDGDAALVVGTNSSVTVPADGSIVVGDGDNQVTITGAVLKAGTYTGTSGKLSLSTTAVIEVADGGAIAVAGSGDLELTLAATKVVLLAGGAVDVKTATGKFGEATQAETKVTVGTAAAPDTPTKADVSASGTPWTVTSTAGTGTGETNVILGALKLAITGTSNVDGQAGAAAEGSAAAGKLVAGQGTVLTFIGTGA